MRITESSLRRLIREVITEERDSESFMMPGSYGAIEDEEMSIKDLEAIFREYSDIINEKNIKDIVDGYEEVVKLQKSHKEAKEAYEKELRGFIGDVIEIHGKDLNRNFIIER